MYVIIQNNFSIYLEEVIFKDGEVLYLTKTIYHFHMNIIEKISREQITLMYPTDSYLSNSTGDVETDEKQSTDASLKHFYTIGRL